MHVLLNICITKYIEHIFSDTYISNACISNTYISNACITKYMEHSLSINPNLGKWGEGV